MPSIGVVGFRNRQSAWSFVGLLGLLILLLSSCAYPQEQRMQNQGNPTEFVFLVQQAVNQYYEKKGVLPIKNSEIDTPLYEKYVIDFSILQKGYYLSTLPTNAYESGGVYMYVLVNVETKPEVKLMDLSAMQAVRELQAQVDAYRLKTNGELPVGISISNDVSYIDFNKLGTEIPQINSVYNRQNLLNYIINQSDGTVAIDYALDMMKFIQDQGLSRSLQAHEDLRERLVNATYFVPVCSYAYNWKDDQPIPITN